MNKLLPDELTNVPVLGLLAVETTLDRLPAKRI
jgi:hypothetical protein